MRPASKTAVIGTLTVRQTRTTLRQTADAAPFASDCAIDRS
jgi:hypothetical protein